MPEAPALPVVKCLDCDATWGLLDKPAPCFTEGHRHEVNGVPVAFDRRLP